ncbi:MAG: 50S ribosomal protein L31 [Christensenellaceae bacterium]|jgi:large subunit ribosomal protein L31|nr:50S ribosomal protein L31 [Christensenellaceae bacterium]
MKEGIHPDYHKVEIRCAACGATFTSGSTRKGDAIVVDTCNNCHPFYTGKTKLVDVGGRVDKFNQKLAKKKI